jgi:hypothetical protein
MTARAALVALLAVIAALLPTAAAGAGEPTQTFAAKVFISEKYPAFHGRLHSESAFCAAERLVMVYRVQPGKDELLGHRRSKKDGIWQVSIGDQLTSGAFYAEAPLYGSAALGIACPAARSKTVTVD